MSQKVTIIGTGNVAWHFAPALEKAGFVINEIYGRSEEKALKIAENLYNPTYTDSLDFSTSASSLFILVVSDNAIESIVTEIVLPDDAMIVHTSGSISMDVLELTALEHIGVLYPLQTFSKQRRVKFTTIPLLIEANNADGQQHLEEIASALSDCVRVVNSMERLHVHLAAVFANNFTNHMLEMASQLMDYTELDLDMLEPLIRETVDKALENSPSDAQTGPAIRDDSTTMEKHLQLLESNPRLEELYQLISDNIRENRK